MSRDNLNSITIGGGFNMKGESKFFQGNSVSGSQRQVQVIPPSRNEFKANDATLEEKAEFSQGDKYTFQAGGAPEPPEPSKPEVKDVKRTVSVDGAPESPEPSKPEVKDVERTVSVDGAPESPEPSKPEVKDVERTVSVDGAPEPPSSFDGYSSDSE